MPLLFLKLGIAGTAKNTGKTTATAAIMEELRLRNIPFYLTSIGYDGENLDNITGLPKPKLRLEPGDIVATAEKCVAASTATLKILSETAISTPLGKVLIAQAKTRGLIVTAGPNKSIEVKALGEQFYRMGPGIAIFDGALSRIAPMSETDGFFLATGAAKTPQIPQLARETGLVWRLANLPAIPGAAGLVQQGFAQVTLISDQGSMLRQLPMPSLLNSGQLDAVIADETPAGSTLIVPGIMQTRALTRLQEIWSRRGSGLLFLAFADAIKLLVAGDPAVTCGLLEELSQSGVVAGVLHRTPLLAVTVNPFYPDYRVESKTYQPAFVDFARLQVSVSREVGVPVYNVVKHGAKGLVDLIQTNARPWENPEAFYFH